MAFGDQFLKGFFGSDYLKDFRHASKTFRSDGYNLAPKYKFLFYVRFNLNTAQLSQLAALFPPGTDTTLGYLVKAVDLPSYTFSTDMMNQYNRKRIVQTGIEYQPIQIRFHDDGSDLVRNMWYNYFSYYYKDPTFKYGNPAVTNGTAGPQGFTEPSRGDYNSRDTYARERTQNDWGYIGESYSDATGAAPGGGKPRFFNDITIYGMNQHRFSAYTLINPIITEWRHDTYDYSEGGGTMEHTMQVQYETVKYYSGRMSGQTPDSIVKGFADPALYDVSKSPLARPGSTTSIFGPAGLIDGATAAIGQIQDAQSLGDVLGAVQTAGRTFEAFRGKNLQSVLRGESQTILRDVLRNGTNGRGDFVIPKGIGDLNPLAGQPNTPKVASTTDDAYEQPSRVQFVGLEDD